MEIAEVAKIFKIIKQKYASFDARVQSVQENFRYLRDIPFEVAVKNVDKHIMTDKFPPTIADIRGGLGEQLERQRSKDDTETLFTKLDEWALKSAPPPPGNRQKIINILGGVRYEQQDL